MFSQHAPQLHVDYFLADERTATSEGERDNIARAASRLDAEVVFAPLRELDAAGAPLNRHDPQQLAAALKALRPAR